MSTWRALAAVAALTILSGGRAVAAGAQCGEPKAVLHGLDHEYGEKPAISGSLGTGEPFTITVSPTTGTWTMLIAINNAATGNHDALCSFGSGDHWQAVEAPAAKPSPGSLPDAPALLEHGLRLIRD